MPITLFAIFDQEHKAETLLENKINYYEQGIHSRLFNSKVFWSWFFFGTWHSIIIVFVPYLSLELNFSDKNGLAESFWASGAMVFGICVIVVNLKVLIISNTLSVIGLTCITMSILLHLFSLLIMNEYTYGELYKIAVALLSIPNYNLGNFLIIASTCLLDFGHEMFLSTFLPVFE